MAIIDVFMYNGERDVLDIRFNILKDYVDEFIIVEAPTTFSGKAKPLYELYLKDEYPDLPITYYVIDENYSTEELLQAFKSPNTQGAEHWKHEFCQKESIKKALVHLNDDDTVFISDCDEIWNPSRIEFTQIFKFKQFVYVYWLNNLSTEKWTGSLVSPYKYIKDRCLNELRTENQWIIENGGWHFTSLKNGLKRKLEDSYTNEDYANEWVMQHLEENVNEGKDFLGRDFRYKLNEDNWPDYLKNNKDKYIHLCKM